MTKGLHINLYSLRYKLFIAYMIIHVSDYKAPDQEDLGPLRATEPQLQAKTACKRPCYKTLWSETRRSPATRAGRAPRPRKRTSTCTFLHLFACQTYAISSTGKAQQLHLPGLSLSIVELSRISLSPPKIVLLSSFLLILSPCHSIWWPSRPLAASPGSLSASLGLHELHDGPTLFIFAAMKSAAPHVVVAQLHADRREEPHELADHLSDSQLERP